MKHQLIRDTARVSLNKLFDFAKAFPDDETAQIYVGEPTYGDIPELDPNYFFPEQATLELMTILEKPVRNNVWLYGPSGSGKTTLTRNLAAKVGACLYEFNGDIHKRVHDAFGRLLVVPTDNGNVITQFRYAIVSKWLQTGGWLLCNEWDTFDSSIVNAFKPALEFPRTVTLTENNDQRLYGHPDCRLIVACNTQGRGDETGQFINTNVQSIADMRRFDAFIEVDYIDKEHEAAMLTRMFPDTPTPVITAITTVAEGTRKAYKAGSLQRVLSTAEVINWTENYSLFMSVNRAARISFLNGYEKEPAMAVRDLITVQCGPEDREMLKDADKTEAAADSVNA